METLYLLLFVYCKGYYTRYKGTAKWRALESKVQEGPKHRNSVLVKFGMCHTLSQLMHSPTWKLSELPI